MAYTHLGAAVPSTSKKRSPVRAAPAKKASTLAPAVPARPQREIKSPPPPLPKVAWESLVQAQVIQRLVELLSRESKIREGVRELVQKAQQDSARCAAASLALKEARKEVARLRLTAHLAKSPLSHGVMAQVVRKASNAAHAAASAAADLKAVKAGLIVWSKALDEAKSNVKEARTWAVKKGAAATAIPASPSEKPEVAAADKQAEQVAAQVTKDVEKAVSIVVEETKAVVADAKAEAPEVLEELKESVKEATEPTKGAEVVSNSAGGDGSKLPLPMLAAGAVGLLLLLRR